MWSTACCTECYMPYPPPPRYSGPPNISPDCVNTRACGAPAPRMELREARSGVEVGTRLANSGFSHSLSLEPWKGARTPAHVCLPNDTGTVCGTVQADRTPALPAGHRDDVRCGASAVRTGKPSWLGWGKVSAPRLPEHATMSRLFPEPPGCLPAGTRDAQLEAVGWHTSLSRSPHGNQKLRMRGCGSGAGASGQCPACRTTAFRQRVPRVS